MGSTALHTNITEYCLDIVKLKEHMYLKAKLAVLTDLCTDVVIGHDILNII